MTYGELKSFTKKKIIYNVKVNFKIYPKENNLADVEYVIEEGKKFQIKKIEFIGNTAYSSSKLKGVIDTSEKGLLSFLTSSGDLNQEILSQDTAKLTAFYQNNGYIQARVGEPEVNFEEDGIVVTFRIEEGRRFKVGKVYDGRRLDYSGGAAAGKSQNYRGRIF